MQTIAQILSSNPAILPAGATWTTEDDADGNHTFAPNGQRDINAGRHTFGLAKVEDGYLDQGGAVTITLGDQQLVITDFYGKTRDADGDWVPSALIGWQSVTVQDGQGTYGEPAIDFDDDVDNLIAGIQALGR